MRHGKDINYQPICGMTASKNPVFLLAKPRRWGVIELEPISIDDGSRHTPDFWVGASLSAQKSFLYHLSKITFSFRSYFAEDRKLEREIKFKSQLAREKPMARRQKNQKTKRYF